MNIEVSETTIPRAGGELRAHMAAPRDGGNLPAVIVIHEIYGIRGHVDVVCRRLAELGCVALAPHFYDRHGDIERMTDFAAIHAVSKAVPDAEVMDDLDSAFAFLAAQPRIDAARIAITGFCWGGREVWLYAERNARLRAGVAWYGGPVSAEASALRPRHPIDVVDGLRVPVLGLYGDADAIIPLPTITALQSALAARGNASRIELFADAPHAFHAHNRPNYRDDAARRGWALMIDWFRRHGVLDQA